jgi:hypothetical protein
VPKGAFMDNVQSSQTFDVIGWLNGFSQEARDLNSDEINSVMQFSLIWNMFEAQVCNKHASASCFLRKSEEWNEKGLLNDKDYTICLEYFKNRYIENGEPNYRFPHLHLRRNDEPELVKSVLKGEDTSIKNTLAVLLIIIYRYRNNLFHGLKWVHDLHEQANNFNIANQILAKVIEINQKSKTQYTRR